MQRFLLCALMLLLTWLPTQAQADAQLSGTTCMSSEGEIVGNIPLQGGRFVCQGVLKITQAGQYVIDFKNTSTLAQFQHEISDGHHTMHVLSGGLSSEHTDQLLLRHGRLVALQPGTYRLITWLQSPYYLAQPEVFVTDLASHQQQTNVSTAVSLLLLGILLGIFSYYMAIGIMPGHVTERMYALFILGNLIFQSAVLGLFKQLFDWHWFYLTSLPILFSNLAYISFVCHLLGISPFRHSRLYQVSIAARLTLLALMVFAMIYPNWMLEMDRLGVAVSWSLAWCVASV